MMQAAIKVYRYILPQIQVEQMSLQPPVFRAALSGQEPFLEHFSWELLSLQEEPGLQTQFSP
jgi:hypothetical protein